jgi:hypothetical protein
VREMGVWMPVAAMERRDYIPGAAFAATCKDRVEAVIRKRGTCWLLATELNAVYGNFLPE